VNGEGVVVNVHVKGILRDLHVEKHAAVAAFVIAAAAADAAAAAGATADVDGVVSIAL